MSGSRAEYFRRYRKLLREQGMCTVCRKVESDEGMTRCRPCADRWNETRHDYKDEGRCWYGDELPPGWPNKHCPGHLEDMSMYRKYGTGKAGKTIPQVTSK